MDTVTAAAAKNMRNDINIEGTIKSKGEPRTVNTKRGTTIDVCDTYLVDSEGGEIKLTLWGDDIARVKENDTVKITNAYTSTFKGEVALSLGKVGKIEVESSQ
jgi:replication factor A1